MSGLDLTDADVMAARGPKNSVDPFRPHAMQVEAEYSADGVIADVATVFLTNRECPFHCVMCDLWKNTADERVPAGAIPAQIEFALKNLRPAQHIKLYNSGNFFDAQAIPPDDLPRIAKLVSGFQSVIVENHPKLCTHRVVGFQQQCGTSLEVALGLETSHAPTLRRLNKLMTTDDFATACRFLLGHNVRLRTFILLKPPGTSEAEGIERAVESVRFAFDHGVNCCAVIPTRTGNGIMDQLRQRGLFSPPALSSLEVVMEETLSWKRGRVFADLWDVRQFATCADCVDARIARLKAMNLTQTIPPAIRCARCDSGHAS
ncbi:MAG: radical SAM protein [Planctomycetaceae bacterium]